MTNPLDELKTLIAEIKSLDRPQDMPRRAQVCHKALALVDVSEQPRLWAALQSQIASSLWATPARSTGRRLLIPGIEG